MVCDQGISRGVSSSQTLSAMDFRLPVLRYLTEWNAFVAWFDTGKPLPRRDDARICPPRTCTGHPFVITQNGASGSAAHYNSAAPLLPAASPPVSPDCTPSPAPVSPSEAAVSTAPAIISRLDNYPCDGRRGSSGSCSRLAAAPAASNAAQRGAFFHVSVFQTGGHAF